MRIATAKIGKRNHIQRIEMSSDVHPNVTIKAAAAAAIVIAPNIAKNHRNILVQRINRNHRQMTVHLVQSKVTSHYRRVNGISVQQPHPVMSMVSQSNCKHYSNKWVKPLKFVGNRFNVEEEAGIDQQWCVAKTTANSEITLIACYRK